MSRVKEGKQKDPMEITDKWIEFLGLKNWQLWPLLWHLVSETCQWENPTTLHTSLHNLWSGTFLHFQPTNYALKRNFWKKETDQISRPSDVQLSAHFRKSSLGIDQIKSIKSGNLIHRDPHSIDISFDRTFTSIILESNYFLFTQSPIPFEHSIWCFKLNNK